MVETRKPKVLLVEREVDGSTGLAEALEQTALDVRRVPDGVSGIDAALRHRPDVILCADDIPPDGGVALCRRVRGDDSLRAAHLIVVAGDAAGVIRALDAGADDAVERTYRADVLHAKIRAGLRLRRLRETAAEDRQKGAVRALAAALGHEVNNPLTALLGHLELVLRYVERGDSERVEHHLRRAGEVAGRIGQVAHRLSRLVEPRRRPYLDDQEMIDLSPDEETVGGYGISA